MGFILPAVNLGLGLLGGLFGRKRRKQLEQLQMQGLEGLGSLGKSFQGFGEQATKGGLEDLGLSGDFFKQLMAGNPQFLNELTGGTMSQQARSLAQQRNFAQRMGTRSGGTAAAIAEAPAQLQSSIRGLQLGARSTGAKGLAEIGSQLGQLGGQYGQVSGGAFGRMSGGASEAYDKSQQQSGAFGEKLAGAFGEPIAGQFGKLFNRPKALPTTVPSFSLDKLNY